MYKLTKLTQIILQNSLWNGARKIGPKTGPKIGPSLLNCHPDFQAVGGVHQEVSAEVVKHDGVGLVVAGVLVPQHSQWLDLREFGNFGMSPSNEIILTSMTPYFSEWMVIMARLSR